MKKLLQNSLKTKIKLILFITFYIFVCINSSKAVDEKKFALWKTDLINDAKLVGISEETIDKAFKDVKIIDKVIELDRKQPEKTRIFCSVALCSVTLKSVTPTHRAFICTGSN